MGGIPPINRFFRWGGIPPINSVFRWEEYHLKPVMSIGDKPLIEIQVIVWNYKSESSMAV